MNDILGYIIFNYMVRLGYFVVVGVNYGSMLKFFVVNYKEIVEYFIVVYKFGFFNKIFEFVRFREKLQNFF